jgi:CRP-like cAMP-binding protein
MLCDGAAQRIAVSALRSAMDQQPNLRRVLLRYSCAFYNQAAHTALSNALSPNEQRLARWLLMAHDRVPADWIPLTHELTAEMIGIRRPGVTIILNNFAQRGMLKLERGGAILLDRKAIKGVAGGFYGLPEKEYARLVSTHWPPRA